ncbi:putative manganese-dependent inorganic diphosphatase [Neomoorella thermoacetica]|uniref:inorganic diphosphatase n=3 Tax=Neomoorella thermoacetica TaxID=1525 RepID=L8EA52_NEOTH|nr:putative manganese-dependent inorganic diphosphatase [Moorella thermoacetica]AKX95273.1 cobalt-dependent inorganic pyrophosphatase [Moorella thermoacetica]AKX97898.1 cobalt-dependent inorganic pyrophosphatase [Moorella thermoacetica]AOQ25387.1 Cobalt-dependent inorganic pyrophosphatase [Moorella thermoacetica]OIQ10077.1 cobalt-dependent inorganic pyrophosphatase [Moorella thermoacetica]OIQ54112.1 cobalt-dependent inorganic pyrophosphatase [Moorella thermoacetica]
MGKEILVIGHQRPDTDSIAAAIGYAALRNKTDGGGFQAARCGKLNGETEFVLSYFDVPVPPLVNDVRARVKDVLDGGLLFIQPGATVRQAGIFMRQHGVKTLAVVDENRHLLGLFTVGDLARLLLEAWDTGNVPMDEPVYKVMQSDNLVIFNQDDLITEVRRTMLETRYRNYPVVDDNHCLVGLIARYHLLAMRGKRVILVDHNEKSQAVPGIEEAETVEIIDHHRVADIETAEPIMVRNEPVGSTATIIARMYKERGLDPDAAIAGVLCAAILSDTLLFKSPTTTQVDKELAAWLADIAGLDVANFGREMFRAGSSLRGRSGREIILEDFKSFNFGSNRVGIGQIEIIDPDTLPVGRDELQAELEKLQAEKQYDLVVLMVTDLMRNGTELLFAGPQGRAVELAFNVTPGEKSVFLPGVMSRKKQVVPPLRRLLQG